MKKIFFAFAVLSFCIVGIVPKASAQHYYYDNNYYDNDWMFEVGGSLAAMNCLTDVGGTKGLGKKFKKDLNMGVTQLAGSAYLSASYQNKYTLRLEGSFGNIKAYDSILFKDRNDKDTRPRYNRNLSFRSKISEISLIAEIHPLFIINNYGGEYDDKEPPRYSPYVAVGVGFYSFNPQAKLASGKWVDLQPLSTEGQGFAEYPDRQPYKLKQICIPIGAGIKYEISPMFNVRAEFLLRKLNTDYLDDVSTRYVEDPDVLYAKYFTGNKYAEAIELNNRSYHKTKEYAADPGGRRGQPKNNDSYFTFNIKFGINFGRERIQ